MDADQAAFGFGEAAETEGASGKCAALEMLVLVTTKRNSNYDRKSTMSKEVVGNISARGGPQFVARSGF